MKNVSSHKGNLSLVILVALLTGSASAILLKVASNYTKHSQSVKKNAATLQTALFDLNLVVDKFRTKNFDLPVWYPDPYPTLEQLSDLQLKPIIRVIKKESSTASTLIPLLGTGLELGVKLSTYDLDITKMGMVEKQENVNDNYQTAWISSGDMDALKAEDLAAFFSKPKSAWPRSINSVLDLSKLRVNKLTFLSYEREPQNKNSIRGIKVQTGKTTSIISIEHPVDPACEVKLATVNSDPILGGSLVRFTLSANSIVSYATVKGEGSKTLQKIFPSKAQSISNLGYFKEVDDFILKAPDLPLDDDTEYLTWKVEANVFGLGKSGLSKSCSVELKVFPSDYFTAPPTCTLTSDHTKYPYYCGAPNPWGWSTYTLKLKVKGVGQFDKVTIDGRTNYTPSEPFNPKGGSYTFSLPSYLTDKTIVAELTGPTGKIACSTQISSSCSPDYPVWSWADQMVLYPLMDRPMCQYWACRWYGCFWPRNCGWGCFESSTKVKLGNGKVKKVKDVQDGDTLWNPVLKKAVKIKKIVVGPELKPLVRLKMGKSSIVVTATHPFLTKRGMKAASEIEKNDWVLNAQNKYELITGKRDVKPKQGINVYNFEMDTNTEREEEHMIEANGFATGDYFIQGKLEKQESPR